MTTARARLTLRRTICVAESSPIALSLFAQERFVGGVLAATSTIWILPAKTFRPLGVQGRRDLGTRR